MSADLLTQALERASLKSNALNADPRSPIRTSRRGRSRAQQENEESDDDAPAGLDTPVSGSAAGSRSTSPTRTGSRMAERRRQREMEAATSHDPLRRLPNELASRIFLLLGVKELAVCMRVCKKWKKSQTINYCWYVLLQQKTFLDATNVNGPPAWSKKDARENWSMRYRSVHRRDDLNYASAADADYDRARSDGYRTPREEREARWAEENADASGTNASKAEMREYYKVPSMIEESFPKLTIDQGLKNAKGSKGGGRSSGRDRTDVWDD